MRLILVRHAEAEDAVGSDEARRLTPRGHLQAANLRDALRRAGVVPDLVAASPLVRTVETAEALAALLPEGLGVVAMDLLKPGGLRPKKLSKQVAEFGMKTVVLVGHMPDLSTYAAWLLGVAEYALPFEKGAALGMSVRRGEIEEGSGVLEWFVTPAWCEPAAEVTSP